MRRLLPACALATGLVCAVGAAGTEPVDWDEMKRRWPNLTAAERADYGELQRRWFVAQGVFAEPDKTAGNVCTQAKFEITDLPFVARNSTIGICSGSDPVELPLQAMSCAMDEDCPEGETCSVRTDNVNVSFFGACRVGGTQMTATGLGPDLFYRIQVNETCQLQVSLQPQSRDLALYVVQNCFSPAATCRGISDGGESGVAEQVTFQARSTESYYIIVDGFAGAADDFELTVEEVSAQGAPLVGCMLVPVELQRFTVE